jgi:hypothetical protein
MNQVTRAVSLYIENTEDEWHNIRQDIADGKGALEIRADWEENLEDLIERLPAGFTAVWQDILRAGFEGIDWRAIVEAVRED